jgi:hypothetical protein
MVVMQDGGDLVTILPCSQISLKNGMLPISTKQKLISCATYQKHIIYGNSTIVFHLTKRKQKLTGPHTEFAKLLDILKIFLQMESNPTLRDSLYIQLAH